MGLEHRFPRPRRSVLHGDRLPVWPALALGVLLIGAGALLIVRPLTALGVLGWYIGLSCLAVGIGELLPSRWRGPSPDDRAPDSRARWPIAVAWMLFGLLVLIRVGRDVDLLGPAIALALIGSGLVGLLGLIRSRSADHWLGALTGGSEVVFGLIALLWPDATLIVIAVLFGGRTALSGLSLLRRAVHRLRPPAPGATATRRHGNARPLALRWAAAVLIVATATTTVVVSRSLRADAPVADAFYQAPGTLPSTPGTLVRWEPYDGDLPTGMTGYRLLYVTTDATDTPVLASAALAVPTGTTTPAPLITWAHGTVGVARDCAPTIGPDAITEAGMPAMDALVPHGWAMVATDYPGMGTDGAFPFLIGEGEGRAVLDAARAARQVPRVSIADETVVWGHSQGGHAALWAGQLAASYAPDVRVVGTAALSPASDPEAIAQSVLDHPGAPGASLATAFVVDAYARYYDLDEDRVLAPSARTLVREAAARCTGQGATLVTVLTGLAIARDRSIIVPGALDGEFGDRLRDNIATGPWSAPLLFAQGEADQVVPVGTNRRYVAGLCAAEVDVETRWYPGGSHMSVLATGSELSTRLEQWTADRFAGAGSTGNCP